jgi:hypothetical protein
MRSGHSRDSTTAEVRIWGRCRTNWISVQYIGASKDSNTKCLAPCGLCAPLLKRRNWATSDIERQLRVGEVLRDAHTFTEKWFATSCDFWARHIKIGQKKWRSSKQWPVCPQCPARSWEWWNGAFSCILGRLDSEVGRPSVIRVCFRMFQADPQHFVLSSTHPRARTCRLQSLSWRCRLHCPGNHTDLQADWVKQTDALTNVTMTKTKSD